MSSSSATCTIDSDAVKRAVFDCLENYQDYSTVTNKQLRSFVEQKLSLPPGYLKGDHRNLLIQAAVDYREIVSLRESQPRGNTDDSDDSDGVINSDEDDPSNDIDGRNGRNSRKRGTGKFSRHETEIIRRQLETYAAQRGIDPTSLVPLFRDDDDPNQPKKMHSGVWKLIQQQLPHRTIPSIYHRSMRILSRHIGNGTFSEAQQNQLLELVRIYGHDFQRIGRLMEKLPDDCVQQLVRLQGREVAGYFSRDEDLALLQAVRELSEIEDDQPLPTQGIPWTQLSIRLGCQRLPLDYSRHWPVLLLKIGRAGGEESFIRRCRTLVPGVEGIVLHSLGEGETVSGTAVAAAGRGAGRASQVGSGVGAMSRSGVIKVRAVTRDAESVRRRNLELLEKLSDMDCSDESEVVWRELDVALNVQPGSSKARWRLLLRSCPSDDPAVYTFEEKLEYLLELNRSLGSSTSRRGRVRNRLQVLRSGAGGGMEDDDDGKDEVQQEEEAIAVEGRSSRNTSRTGRRGTQASVGTGDYRGGGDVRNSNSGDDSDTFDERNHVPHSGDGRRTSASGGSATHRDRGSGVSSQVAARGGNIRGILRYSTGGSSGGGSSSARSRNSGITKIGIRCASFGTNAAAAAHDDGDDDDDDDDDDDLTNNARLAAVAAVTPHRVKFNIPLLQPSSNDRAGATKPAAVGVRSAGPTASTQEQVPSVQTKYSKNKKKRKRKKDKLDRTRLDEVDDEDSPQIRRKSKKSHRGSGHDEDVGRSSYAAAINDGANDDGEALDKATRNAKKKKKSNKSKKHKEHLEDAVECADIEPKDQKEREGGKGAAHGTTVASNRRSDLVSDKPAHEPSRRLPTQSTASLQHRADVMAADSAVLREADLDAKKKKKKKNEHNDKSEHIHKHKEKEKDRGSSRSHSSVSATTETAAEVPSSILLPPSSSSTSGRSLQETLDNIKRLQTQIALQLQASGGTS